MDNRQQLHVVIEKTNTGYSAYVKEFDGLITVGDSFGEVKLNINEVIQEHIEYLEEIGETTNALTNAKLNYVVDLEQFFDYFKIINKSAFAEYAGINQSLFRQYTKGLAPISGKKMAQISKGLNKLAFDLEGLELA
mgnify:CR=1 FL=1